MAYGDDIDALSPTHRFSMDNTLDDQVGSERLRETGASFNATSICVDTTQNMQTSAFTHRIEADDGTVASMGNAASTRRAVCGWFVTTAYQTHPVRIYGEGSNTTTFQIVMAYGNNVMFECVEPTNFTLQVYGLPLAPNREYHLYAEFQGSGFDNTVRFYIDGVEQTLSEPATPAPGTADLNSRGSANLMTYGDPNYTVGIGGDVVLTQAALNGRYAQWAIWHNVALPSAANIRSELFEKGALPTHTIASGTESAMQTSLDGITHLSTDTPNDIQIAANTGDTSFELTATNIVHNSLASIHVQYMGTATLTWVNSGTSNASIGSTPNGGTITFVNIVTVRVTVKDAATGGVIQGARVLMEATAGGPLPVDTKILDGTTNASGIIEDTGFRFTTSQGFAVKARKGTSAPLYKTASGSGSIEITGAEVTLFMVADE